MKKKPNILGSGEDVFVIPGQFCASPEAVLDSKIQITITESRLNTVLVKEFFEAQNIRRVWSKYNSAVPIDYCEERTPPA